MFHVERKDGEWESGGGGEWESGRIGYFLCLSLSPSLAPSLPRSPALPLPRSPAPSVPRGTDDVHYISLIRTRNQQALYLLIMCKRARLFFEALRPEDQNL